MKDIVIFDLDGTLALIEHRLHFLAGKKKNWEKFFAVCDSDAPHHPIVAVMKALRATGHETWIVSGRSDAVKTQTINWFEKHGIEYDKLIMRRDGDYTPDDILKRSWLQSGAIPKERVLMVFDDRDKVVAMWRKEGLVCAQVAAGDF